MLKKYIIGEYDSLCNLVMYKGKGLTRKDIINFKDIEDKCEDLDEVKLVPVYDEQKKKLMFEFIEVI